MFEPASELVFAETFKKRRCSQSLEDFLEDILPSAAPSYNDFNGLFGIDQFVIPEASSASFDNSAESNSDTCTVTDELSLIAPPPYCESSYERDSKDNLPAARSRPKLAKAAAVIGEDDALSLRREKNRLAAERCRQKKTMLIETLQQECDELRLEKERLLMENARLLKALGFRI